MKAYVTKNRVFLISFLAGALVMLAGRVTAQTFTTLHSFTLLLSESYESSLLYTNADGAYPYAGFTVTKPISATQ